MKGEDEMQFLLSGLLLQIQPLHSSEQHTRAHLEFYSQFELAQTSPNLRFPKMKNLLQGL